MFPREGGPVSGELHHEILERLRALPWAGRMEMPPKVFSAMQGRFEAYEPGEWLETRWPVLDWYRGPTGVMQGGWVAAAFDNTYGPLAFLTAGCFAATVSLSTTFHRPVADDRAELRVKAIVEGQTERLFFMRGEARDEDGRLMATSRTEMFLFR